MKILVTGANGFIGKHMVVQLKRQSFDVLTYDRNNSIDELKQYILDSDFVVHLAGINRPLTKEEFYDGNTNFTKQLVDLVIASKKDIPIIMSSSIQASLDNDYGKSKKMAEDYLLSSGLNVYIYRLANVFGKWCKPNYNSVVATFCYNIAHKLPISISDPSHIVNFNYVDDICDEFINVIKGHTPKNKEDNHYLVSPKYECSLKKLSELLYYFLDEVHSEHHLPLLYSEFEFKLFKTFINYLSDDGYLYNYASDNRGSFEELYKSKKYGQISENISFANIIKGGHYHTYKNEIFYTVIGECEIKQRNIFTNEMKIDVVNGVNPKLVNILPNYIHQIKNIGTTSSHTLMWISEIYNVESADTYIEPVEKDI